MYDDEFQLPTKYPIKTLKEIRGDRGTIYCQFIEENYIYITAKGEIMPCCHYNPGRFLELFGYHKELDNIYNASKNDINIHKSTIEKALKSPLFSYITKNKKTLPLCNKTCSILVSEKMFKEIPTKCQIL